MVVVEAIARWGAIVRVVVSRSYGWRRKNPDNQCLLTLAWPVALNAFKLFCAWKLRGGNFSAILPLIARVSERSRSAFTAHCANSERDAA